MKSIFNMFILFTKLSLLSQETIEKEIIIQNIRCLDSCVYKVNSSIDYMCTLEMTYFEPSNKKEVKTINLNNDPNNFIRNNIFLFIKYMSKDNFLCLTEQVISSIRPFDKFDKFEDVLNEDIADYMVKNLTTINNSKFKLDYFKLINIFNFPYHKYSNEIYNLVMEDKKITEDEIFIIGKYKVYTLRDSLYKFYDEEYFYNTRFKLNGASDIYVDVLYALSSLGDDNSILPFLNLTGAYYKKEELFTKNSLLDWKESAYYNLKTYAKDLEEVAKHNQNNDQIMSLGIESWYPPISDLYFTKSEMKMIKHQDSIYDGLIEDNSLKRDKYFLPHVYKAIYRIEILKKNYKDRDLPAKSFRKPDYKKGKAIYEYKLKHKLIEPFED